MSFAEFQGLVDAKMRSMYERDERALRAVVRPKPSWMPFRLWRAILRRVLYLEDAR